MFTYIRKNKESKIYKIPIPILRRKFWERPYYFDISKAKSEFLNNFNIKQKFKDQKDYFINKEEYICN